MERKRPKSQKNKLRKLSRKEELNGWKCWREEIIDIDGGFCPKLDPWTNRGYEIR